jgi:hypothetical protein
VPRVHSDSDVSGPRKNTLVRDGASTYELVRHYGLVGNDTEAHLWARIGAENGEHDSMMLMGFESGRKGRLDGCRRAVYWLTRTRTELQADDNSRRSSVRPQWK